MSKVGDGPEGQPTEGVESLSTVGNMFGEEAEETPETGADEDAEESEEETSEDDSQDEQEEPRFTIKVDGKDIELPQSELIELAQKGTDYTQKTMAVAEERKAVESERAQVTEARKQYEQVLTESVMRLDAYTKYMESQIGSAPDTALLDYDTAGYLKAKEIYEARKGQLQQAYAATQELQQEHARQRQAWIQEKSAATEQALQGTLSGWNNDMLHELADYAGKLGLDPQNADAAMLEPGFWQLAHKAREFDRIQAAKSQLKPKVDMPKVSKPGASNPISKQQSQRAKSLDAFARKPSLTTLGGLL